MGTSLALKAYFGNVITAGVRLDHQARLDSSRLVVALRSDRRGQFSPTAVHAASELAGSDYRNLSHKPLQFD
jgi:hypothetical protein